MGWKWRGRGQGGGRGEMAEERREERRKMA
jgi:hypothetical protein